MFVFSFYPVHTIYCYYIIKAVFKISETPCVRVFLDGPATPLNFYRTNRIKLHADDINTYQCNNISKIKFFLITPRSINLLYISTYSTISFAVTQFKFPLDYFTYIIDSMSIPFNFFYFVPSLPSTAITPKVSVGDIFSCSYKWETADTPVIQYYIILRSNFSILSLMFSCSSIVFLGWYSCSISYWNSYSRLY
jgi:hypothetical protein